MYHKSWLEVLEVLAINYPSSDRASDPPVLQASVVEYCQVYCACITLDEAPKSVVVYLVAVPLC